MDKTPVSLLDRLCRTQEEAAWVRFVDLYSPLLYHWARRAGLSDGDAADLVQDVLTTLVRKLPEFKYDRERSFRGWLRSVLHNRWRDRCRRQAIAPQAATLDAVPEPEISDPALELDASEYRQYLTRRALELAQSHFQPATWKACWGQVVEGRSAAEVAAELGISEGAAYVAKCRVLRRLRDELAELLD
jgi:RNA polymerase sigma-70 factor (ECF subfamily)